MIRLSTLHWLLVALAMWTVAGCHAPEPTAPDDALVVPAHFPLPTQPEDNVATAERIALGRRLFFDPLLSVDSSVSCASCHHPSRAFSDTVALSVGVNGGVGKRNAPTLVNVAYAPKLFMDGGVNTLEHQVISPLENPNEMAFKLHDAAARLATIESYQRMSEAAYQRPFSAAVLVRALAAFERSLVGGTSPYDAYLAGDSSALSAKAQKGMALFFSDRLACSSCHSGVLFTGYGYENNGLRMRYEDVGRAGVTMRQEDKYRFKVPTLRNVALTGPYMHDGSIASLEEVIVHYDRGGVGHPQQSDNVRPLGLTAADRAALLAFLEALTDR